MAAKEKAGPPQKGNKDSGRTIGRLIQRSQGASNPSNEAANRKLRQKIQPKPMGKARFPDPAWPKYKIGNA